MNSVTEQYENTKQSSTKLTAIRAPLKKMKLMFTKIYFSKKEIKTKKSYWRFR